MLNLMFTGHLGGDAEIKEGNGSGKFLSFNVAVDMSYKNADGQKVQRTEWIGCAYNNLAIGQYLKKGTQVLISGTPKNKAGKKQDGSWTVYQNCSVEKLELLSSKKDDQRQPPQAVPASVDPDTGEVLNDDQYPF